MTAPGGDTWQFVYDPTANVPAVLAEVKNGDLQAFYVREPGGELIARVAGEDRKYYFFDGLGSVMAMAPAVEGNPTDRYFYTPWGEPDTRAQSLSATTGNPYRYVGQLGYYFHHQIPGIQNWLQLGVRFYAPEAGRFERRDPLPLRPNRYSYVSDQVFRYVDPRGLHDETYKPTPGGVDINIPTPWWIGASVSMGTFCCRDKYCRMYCLEAISICVGPGIGASFGVGDGQVLACPERIPDFQRYFDGWGWGADLAFLFWGRAWFGSFPDGAIGFPRIGLNIGIGGCYTFPFRPGFGRW